MKKIFAFLLGIIVALYFGITLYCMSRMMRGGMPMYDAMIIGLQWPLLVLLRFASSGNIL